jgi:hypothetical protein
MPAGTLRAGWGRPGDATRRRLSRARCAPVVRRSRRAPDRCSPSPPSPAACGGTGRAPRSRRSATPLARHWHGIGTPAGETGVNGKTTPARHRACSSRGGPWPDGQTPACPTTDGTATNAGDAAAHSLTFAFKTAWSTEVLRLSARAVVVPLEYLSSDGSSWRGDGHTVVHTPAAVDCSAPIDRCARVAQPTCAADQLSGQPVRRPGPHPRLASSRHEQLP